MSLGSGRRQHTCAVMIIRWLSCPLKIDRIHDRKHNEYQVFSVASFRKQSKFGLSARRSPPEPDRSTRRRCANPATFRDSHRGGRCRYCHQRLTREPTQSCRGSIPFHLATAASRQYLRPAARGFRVRTTVGHLAERVRRRRRHRRRVSGWQSANRPGARRAIWRSPS